MGGSSKSGGGGDAKFYRQQEQDRQERIRQGTDAINATFDGLGGRVAGGAYDPAQTYYRADGSVWQPSPAAPTAAPAMAPAAAPASAAEKPNLGTLFMSPSAGAKAAKENRTAQAARATGAPAASPAAAPAAPDDGGWSDAVAGGLYTSRSGGFDDAFYDKQRQAYLDFAMPQLEDQRGSAAKELTFALARGGQLGGSVRASKEADLQKTYDLQAQGVTEKALDYAAQSRTGVEGARADLVAQLNATGDASGAAAGAVARAKALSETPAYSPLVGLFSDFTSGLGTAVAADRARAYGFGAPETTGTTLYGPRNGAVAVKG